MSWIKLPDQNWSGIIVHEVKCPICKYKETYHGDKVPESCFICGTKLKEAENDNT